VDVLAVILACSLYPDDALVRALVELQSEGNVYFVGDTSTLQSKDALKSVEDALRVAEGIRAHGGRPAVGLLGVPLDWAARYERSPRELFDGCTNIAVGTAALAEYHDSCAKHSRAPPKSPSGHRMRVRQRRLDSSALRSCVLEHFAVDLGVKGQPAAILRAIATDRRAVHQADLPEHAEVFGDVPAEDISTDAWTDITGPVALPPRQRSRDTERAAGTNPTDPKGSSK
jgi:hypothetical protein